MVFPCDGPSPIQSVNLSSSSLHNSYDEMLCYVMAVAMLPFSMALWPGVWVYQSKVKNDLSFMDFLYSRCNAKVAASLLFVT